ncbi:unnamed protein product [Cylindrotheca closterium]|uniref:Pre-rRNA-processing protein Ipi1 N-terminal domain-containing protein n=1 Tax=Cylindrotheca closterium TaxID=2856 RepID=A0AAD2G8M5_9STRA|nr:unnamed protein product [Cylindrotheca closterium]
MSSKRKSGGQSQSDFKRLKAKVGKRAPKAANFTDTTFKSASIRMADQHALQQIGTGVASARGRSMVDLSLQLSHHAAAVRLSAVKGLGDITRHESTASLRPHLALLIPCCAKSWVDEDDDTRTAGLTTFGELLRKQSETSIRPFMPLIVAYLTSALHSLDSTMRVDGAKAVHLVCSVHPKLLRPHVAKLLKPFIGLLTDRGKLAAKAEILLGLVSLMKVSKVDASDRQLKRASIESCPHFTFVSGGRSRNAIVVEGRSIRPPVAPLSSIQDILSLDRSRAGRTDGENDDMEVIQELMEKVRNILMEILESETMEVAKTKKSPSPQSKEKLISLVFQAIGLLWKRKTRFYEGQPDNEPPEKLQKLAVQVLSILLDMLPLQRGDFKFVNDSTVESLNSTLCTTVMTIGATVPENICQDSEGKQLKWKSQLSSFLLPHLQRYKSDQDYPTSALNVTCDLLLSSVDSASNSLYDHGSAMLKAINEIFFQDSNAALARSQAGRKVAVTVCDILTSLNYPNLADAPLLMDMTSAMSSFLNFWGADCEFETNVTFDALLGIVRSNGTDSELGNTLRNRMEDLVLTEEKGERPAFEIYTTQSQSKFLALMVMLEKPSASCLKGLAKFCSKSSNDTSTADAIVSSLQAIRRSIPMKNYIQFLLTSIVIPKAKSKRKNQSSDEPFASFLSRMGTMDSGVRRVSVALIECGSKRILQMLLPFLKDLLKPKEELEAADSYLRYRASISLLALILLDIQVTTGETDVPPELNEPLVNALFASIDFISASKNSMGGATKLLSPLIGVCHAEKVLLLSLFDRIVDKVADYKTKQHQLKNIVRLLVDISNDDRITARLDGFDQLRGSVLALKQSVQKNGLQKLEGIDQLQALVDVRTGYKERQRV